MKFSLFIYLFIYLFFIYKKKKKKKKKKQNYQATIEFVQEFEKHATSRKNLINLRKSKPYDDFMQRWNTRQLPIYYQIRFKEISTFVEEALNLTTIFPSPDSVKLEQKDGFFFSLLFLFLFEKIDI